MLKQILAFQTSITAFLYRTVIAYLPLLEYLFCQIDSIGGMHLYHLEQISCFNVYLKERKKTDFIQLVGMPFRMLKFSSLHSANWRLQSTSTKELLLSYLIHPSSQEFYLG